jgi:hypothetical protein
VSKGKPIPAKFDPPEERLLHDLNRRTGLSISEIIRRSVRLLGIEIEKRGSGWVDFLIQDLSTNPPSKEPAQSGHEDEKPVKPYGDKKIIGLPATAVRRKTKYSYGGKKRRSSG